MAARVTSPLLHCCLWSKEGPHGLEFSSKDDTWHLLACHCIRKRGKGTWEKSQQPAHCYLPLWFYMPYLSLS
jgi:hypothetical protein